MGGPVVRLFVYWLLSRGAVLLGGTALAVVIAADGLARAAGQASESRAVRRRLDRPARARRGAPGTHPVLVMAVALATWVVVDRILPSGWGVQQTAFAALVAGAAVVFVVLVDRISEHVTGVEATARCSPSL
ncbi:hypothetical protein [Oerskovia flava]|uniref:hypothetical protein n=1 Tax=Oerskovia flava TaxID=2986422 RepID=UPI0022403C51|nr:hypothetical protein [Oerskovia sp. JB1-3-2]